MLYACPRCSDIPELADIKKHLTAKYGKEFVHAAIDLRPDCGVNRMVSYPFTSFIQIFVDGL